MRHGEIRTIRTLNPVQVEKLDPQTTHVYFLNFIPRYEISHRDGKYWSRPFGAPISEPFRPLFSKTLKDATEELWGEAL